LFQVLSYFLALVVIYLPFSSVILNFLSNRIGASPAFWLAHWYEIPVILFFLIGLFLAGKKKLLSVYAIFISGIIVLSIYSVLFLSPSVSQGIEGFRFTFFSLIFLAVGYLFDFKPVIKRAYLGVAAFVALWALIERFLPAGYWQLIGLDGNIGYGQFMAGNFFRSCSVLLGPNQLASYLLPAFFVLLLSNYNQNRALKAAVLAILLAGIILSFSRSAILGLAAGLIIYFFFFVKNNFIKYTSLAFVFVLFIAGFLYLQNNEKLAELLTHGVSQQWHLFAMKESLAMILSGGIKRTLLGVGLGTDGPILLKYGGDRYASESWYLQLLFETGLIGFILWLALAASLLVSLFKKTASGLAVAFVSVLVTALFLHTFADNPAMSFTLFALIGLSINDRNNQLKG